MSTTAGTQLAPGGWVAPTVTVLVTVALAAATAGRAGCSALMLAVTVALFGPTVFVGRDCAADDELVVLLDDVPERTEVEIRAAAEALVAAVALP